MEYCVDNDILKDILLVKKKEVEDIMMTVFSQEQAMEFALKARYREGIKQGIEQGMEQGIEQGIEQGKSMGKYENSLQIAKKMKDSNMDNELIMKFTGLSEDEVSKL
jgi:hypothetical protein